MKTVHRLPMDIIVVEPPTDDELVGIAASLRRLKERRLVGFVSGGRSVEGGGSLLRLWALQERPGNGETDANGAARTRGRAP